MLYAERDDSGTIVAVRNAPTDSGKEPVTEEELKKFLSESGGMEHRTALLHSDNEFVRVLEDLIDLLIQKNILRLTDLPEEAQEKIGRRKNIRQKMRDNITLMVDDIL